MRAHKHDLLRSYYQVRSSLLQESTRYHFQIIKKAPIHLEILLRSIPRNYVFAGTLKFVHWSNEGLLNEESIESCDKCVMSRCDGQFEGCYASENE